jgi:hypothetical protein
MILGLLQLENYLLCNCKLGSNATNELLAPPLERLSGASQLVVKYPVGISVVQRGLPTLGHSLKVAWEPCQMTSNLNRFLIDALTIVCSSSGAWSEQE